MILFFISRAPSLLLLIFNMFLEFSKVLCCLFVFSIPSFTSVYFEGTLKNVYLFKYIHSRWLCKK